MCIFTGSKKLTNGKGKARAKLMLKSNTEDCGCGFCVVSTFFDWRRVRTLTVLNFSCAARARWCILSPAGLYESGESSLMISSEGGLDCVILSWFFAG